MMASSRRNCEIVKLLLDKGAEVNCQNKVSYSSNHVFCFHVPDGYMYMYFHKSFPQTNHPYHPYMYMYYRLVSHCDRDYMYI